VNKNDRSLHMSSSCVDVGTQWVFSSSASIVRPLPSLTSLHLTDLDPDLHLSTVNLQKIDCSEQSGWKLWASTGWCSQLTTRYLWEHLSWDQGAVHLWEYLSSDQGAVHLWEHLSSDQGVWCVAEEMQVLGLFVLGAYQWSGWEVGLSLPEQRLYLLMLALAL
jgi:hypothetical protein